MINERDRELIRQLPEIEHGQALFRWIEDEIKLLDEESGLKICDDPLMEDFRVKMGRKYELKRVLNKPKECLPIGSE